VKLCRYNDDRLGVVLDGSVHDITPVHDEIVASSPRAMHGDPVIAALPQWRQRMEDMARRGRGVPISQVRLLSPVARPSKVMAAPVNYRKHIAEMQNRKDINIKFLPNIGDAGIFLKANSSVVGPSEGIPIRFPERITEHEAEIVLIVGKAGSDIPRERALDHVCGYCLGLDMTVRGSEDRSFRKSMDGYSVVGPWMVTADEIDDPDQLPFILSVNGDVRQKSNTNDLIFDIRKLITFASQFYTLYPGDILYTGTPEGVGGVKAGDTILMRSEPLGEMTVDVRAHRIES
jgi:2-keto-4-pentenoate hydratase/2-oxohepta-3-ene-1,7-dioic acid hydratase in catechol pathway